MNNNRPIGIFDSGVGGLSILSSVQELLPNETLIYFADQKNNPYGGREVIEIRDIASQIITFLLSKNCKLVIVACNTVSVNAIDHLRQKFDIPIIAVVPVVKVIADKTKTGKIAVFSTPATAKSKYLQDLIDKFASGKEVFKIGTSKLEYLVEAGITEGLKIHEAVHNAFAPYEDKNIDSIALGCTHYPFLTLEIQKVVGPKVSIYDSGGAIARRTKQVLEQEGLAAQNKAMDEYYTTGDVEKFTNVAEKLLGKRLVNVKKAEI